MRSYHRPPASPSGAIFIIHPTHASLGSFGKNKHVDFHNMSSKSANSDFPFTLYVLARHYTTGGYAAAIFPLGEYGPFLDFSLWFLSFELLCLPMSSPSDFSFKAKEQLFEQTFYHLSFPVRGKSIVDSLWKSWSPRLNIGDRVHELPFPSRQTVMHTVIMSCQFTRNDSLTWLVESERR